MPGFFSNNSPQWLLDKLRSDFDSLAAHSTDAGKAFTFFVTAESLLDWCAPGYTNKPLRKKLRDDEFFFKLFHTSLPMQNTFMRRPLITIASPKLGNMAGYLVAAILQEDIFKENIFPKVG